MKKVLKKIESIFINLIIIILAIFAIISIYSFVQLNILDKEYIDIIGYSFFQVETGSMSGTIEIDDIVIIKLGNSVEENEIITYKNGNNFITHRVIKKENDSIITKGDKNNAEDTPIKKEDIIGKVVYTINNVKVWKAVFSDVKVIISMAITFVLLILIILYKEKLGENDD